MPERGSRRREADRRKRQIKKDSSLSRRDFLKTAGVSAAVLATATGLGYTIYRTLEKSSGEKEKKIYDGEVSALKGQEIVPPQELDKYLDSLENCSVTFLRKIGKDIRQLSVTTSKPQELPDWINEESFPLAFTKGPGPDSRAVMDILWNNQSPYSFKVNWQEHGIVENPLAFTAWIGTHLGMTPSLEEREPLVKGLFLAKEHISHMLMQRLAEDFSEQLDFFRINEITETNGTPISDPARLKQATVSIFLNQETTQKTTIWKTTDGLPAFYIAHAYNQLVVNGELPGNDGRAIGRLLQAHQIILQDISKNDAGGLKLMVKQMNEWEGSGRLLPPKNVAEVYHNPLRQMIDEWHDPQ